jgi:hypothetical protein
MPGAFARLRSESSSGRSSCARTDILREVAGSTKGELQGRRDHRRRKTGNLS